MALDRGSARGTADKANNPMSDYNDEVGQSNALPSSEDEHNPLLQFLGLVPDDQYDLPVSTEVKRIVFSTDGGELLHALARASRTRVAASLAYLQCTSPEMEADEVIAFLISAPDNLILEQVLTKVEGPGTAIAPGLKSAMRTSPLLRAYAIGILNRLLLRGCNRKAALSAASRKRHLRVRMNLQFAETHELHPLTRQVAYLCENEREIIALNKIISSLASRAPGVLPDEIPLRRLEGLSGLTGLLKQRILKYRGEVAVPDVSHPRLEWLRSVPAIRAAGKVLANCLRSSAAYPTSLLLGRSFVAIYTPETRADLLLPDRQIALNITPTWESGEMVMSVSEARGRENKEISGRKMFEALNDLSDFTGHKWNIDFRIAMDDLNLYDWQAAFE